MSKNPFMPILAIVILASFSSNGFADTAMSQSQQNSNTNSNNISITDSNQVQAAATAKASAPAPAPAPAFPKPKSPPSPPKITTPPASASGSTGKKSGGTTPPEKTPPAPPSPKSSSAANSSSTAAAASNAASTAHAAANNTNKIGVSTTSQQSADQTQSLSGSGNSTLTGSGNSTVKSKNSMRNSGNSASTATTGPISTSIESVSNYEAPRIPVNTAAPVFVNDCQNGLSMQTKKVGMSGATVRYRCELLDQANTEFSIAFKSWQEGAGNVDAYIQQLEDRIDHDRDKIVEIEKALDADSIGKKTHGLSLFRRERYKEKLQELQGRVIQDQSIIDEQYPLLLQLTADAQEHYKSGLDLVAKAGATIKKHRISGMVAEISGDLVAPFAITLGVVSAVKQ